MGRADAPKPKAEYEPDVVPAPSTMTVSGQPRVVLYDAKGRPMVRYIGFKPRKD